MPSNSLVKAFSQWIEHLTSPRTASSVEGYAALLNKPRDDKVLQYGLEVLKRCIFFHDFGQPTLIPPVECPIPFPGCGLVRGCRQGVVVNPSITLVPFEDDTMHSSYLVLLKGFPTLSIRIWDEGPVPHTMRQVRVEMLGDKSYVSSMLADSGWNCRTLFELRAMDVYVQRVMEDLLVFCAMLEVERLDDFASGHTHLTNYRAH